MNLPKFYKYRQATVIQYLDDIVKTCHKSDLVTLELEGPVQAVKEVVDKLSDGFVQLRKSEFTARLNDLDEERDRAMRGIAGIAEAQRMHFDDDKRNAATKIVTVIKGYGKGLIYEKYQVETVKIRNLCVDLTTDPDLIAAVELLKLTDWVAKLNEFNEAFNTLYLERVDEAASTEFVNKNKLIDQGIEAFNTLCSYLDAKAILSPSEDLSELISRVDALTEKYNESN